jgi:hypothetical protein
VVAFLLRDLFFPQLLDVGEVTLRNVNAGRFSRT